jgi:hypothetical protein
MFSIFESVILFFPNIKFLGRFDVIHEEIMQICIARYLNICEDLAKMKERRLKRPYKTLQRKELCSQVPRHIIWKQTPKKKKK